MGFEQPKTDHFEDLNERPKVENQEESSEDLDRKMRELDKQTETLVRARQEAGMGANQNKEEAERIQKELNAHMKVVEEAAKKQQEALRVRIEQQRK